MRNLYAGQEATVRTGHGTTDWFQIGKGVHQGCILSPCLFNFPGGSEDKVSACNAGDLGSIPGLGKSPGEGNGNLLQYSCLENPRDRGAWWAAVYGVAQSRTRLKRLSSSMYIFIILPTALKGRCSFHDIILMLQMRKLSLKNINSLLAPDYTHT